MKNFLLRLTSRKFLMAVVAALTLYLAGDLQGMIIVILGYLGVEGAADTAERLKARTNPGYNLQQTLLDDDGSGNTPAYTRPVVPGSSLNA